MARQIYAKSARSTFNAKCIKKIYLAPTQDRAQNSI